MQTTSRLADRFRDDGFVVIPNFKSADQVAALRRRAAEIVDAFDPAIASGVFTTKFKPEKRDRYFTESANAIRCFFEAEAFDEAGNLRQPKELSINKIGHAMHDLDPVFAEFSHGPELRALAAEIGNDDPRIYQSMYIFKQPRIGGVVDWHQDATFFVTEPQTVTTLWFALEPATRDNGCLWVQRGGHRGPLREMFQRDGEGQKRSVVDATPWPTEADAEPLECDAGTLVMFNGLLPHYSAPNRSAVSRHAYTLHFVDGRAAYSPGNWIQRDASFPARGF
jgi:phytanoyl-CoA hydroxylase